MENSPAAQDALYVDLDGTFFKTDLLFESLLAAAKAHPIVILKFFFWLIQGKAYCKYKVAQFANLSTPVAVKVSVASKYIYTATFGGVICGSGAGLSATEPTGCQLRVAPLQRFGC